MNNKFSVVEHCRKMNERHFLTPFKTSFNKLIANSKRKNIFIDLTYEQFLEFTKINNCFYCSKPIRWKAHGREASNRYNLDRKDNNLGYTKDNLVVCCWECNNLKGNKVGFDDFCLFSALVLKDRHLPHWTNEFAINNFMIINNFDY